MGKRIARIFLGCSVLALVLSVIAWGATYSPSYQKCVTDHGNQERQEKTSDLHEPIMERSGIVIPVFLRCEGDFIDQNNGTLIAIATIALSAFTFTLWRATSRLWESAEGQLTEFRRSLEQNRVIADQHSEHLSGSLEAAKRSADIAERTLTASQRPWLSVEIEVGGPFVFDRNGGARVDLRFIMKNVGNSPALFAWPHACAVLMAADRNILAVQQSLLAEVRGRKRSAGELGLTVFPKDSPVEVRSAVHITADEISAVPKLQDRRTRIIPNIVGFIDYQFPFSEERRETGFVYTLTRIGQDSRGTSLVIWPEDGDMPADKLFLQRWIAEAGGFRAT